MMSLTRPGSFSGSKSSTSLLSSSLPGPRSASSPGVLSVGDRSFGPLSSSSPRILADKVFSVQWQALRRRQGTGCQVPGRVIDAGKALVLARRSCSSATPSLPLLCLLTGTHSVEGWLMRWCQAKCSSWYLHEVSRKAMHETHHRTDYGQTINPQLVQAQPPRDHHSVTNVRSRRSRLSSRAKKPKSLRRPMQGRYSGRPARSARIVCGAARGAVPC